jgi:N-acetylglucosaminyldiphosphoundecaprenol N-acetyl-beta-D-mannosaminyltransferase
VSRMSLDEAIESVWEDARLRNPRVYVLLNQYSVKLGRDDLDYSRAIAEETTIGLADGVGMTWGAALAGAKKLPRCPGPDLFEAGCARAAADGTSFYLLGPNPGTTEMLTQVLAGKFPGLRVAGWACPPHGDWPDDVSDDLVRGIAASRCEVLWLGVSAPKQEKWAAAHARRLNVPIVCVGAAFDFLAGVKPRAPRWMRRAGIEWVFRLATEPKRLWRRYVVGGVVFARELAKHRGARSPGRS